MEDVEVDNTSHSDNDIIEGDVSKACKTERDFVDEKNKRSVIVTKKSPMHQDVEIPIKTSDDTGSESGSLPTNNRFHSGKGAVENEKDREEDYLPFVSLSRRDDKNQDVTVLYPNIKMCLDGPGYERHCPVSKAESSEPQENPDRLKSFSLAYEEKRFSSGAKAGRKKDRARTISGHRIFQSSDDDNSDEGEPSIQPISTSCGSSGRVRVSNYFQGATAFLADKDFHNKLMSSQTAAIDYTKVRIKKEDESISTPIPIACYGYGKAFLSQSTLKDHLQGDDLCGNTLKNDECSTSSYMSNNEDNPDEQLSSSPSESSYECSICNKSFNHSSNLVRHMKTHTGERPYICSICSKAFTRSWDLKIHLRRHTGEKPYPCSKCEKQFVTRNDFRLHMTTHTGEKPHKCSICEKSFTWKIALTAHMNVHTGERPYQCPVCSKSYVSKNALTTHVKKHSGNEPYKCPNCDEAFVTRDMLRMHMETHTEEKVVSKTIAKTLCPICGKEFLRKWDLNLHMKIHTGEKPFQCSQCERAFISRSLLNVHMRRHTGEKPYQCLVCNKAFITNSNLNQHMNSHRDQKSYQCPICERGFTWKLSLNAHMNMHSGERPYECSVCHKAFRHSSNLSTHMKTHTGEKPHICFVCGKAFSRTSFLKNHLKTHSRVKK